MHAANEAPATRSAMAAHGGGGGAPPPSVWCKRVGAPFAGESFARVPLGGAACVADVAAAACAHLRWGVEARDVGLFLAAAGGLDAPSRAAVGALAADEGARLSEAWPLARARVAPGAWLVATIADGALSAELARLTRELAAAAARERASAAEIAALSSLLASASARAGGNVGGGGAGAGGDGVGARGLVAVIDARIAAALAVDGSTSVFSDEEYEEAARRALPGVLLARCGLEVVRGVDSSRAALGGLEWDFRAPVLVAHTEPHPNAEAGSFEVFPRKPSYVRPAAVEARRLTPTKFAGAADAPAAHYLAIFEVTVARKWTRGGAREGLLERLEQRLAISLDRAFSSNLLPSRRILDLVAVVGVVAPAPYSVSVCERMAADGAPPLLKELMDAGRFVFIQMAQARGRASP